MWLHLTAYKLDGLCDRNHAVHARRSRQRLQLMTASATADRSDDGAFFSTRDVRLVACLLHAVNHVLDLSFGCPLPHVDDHDFTLPDRWTDVMAKRPTNTDQDRCADDGQHP